MEHEIKCNKVATALQVPPEPNARGPPRDQCLRFPAPSPMPEVHILRMQSCDHVARTYLCVIIAMCTYLRVIIAMCTYLPVIIAMCM